MAEPLDQCQAHVWYAFPDSLTAPPLLRAYYNLLSQEERARYGRFHFAEGRHSHLVAHALVRTVLARYLQVDPRALRFEANKYGRPDVVEPSAVAVKFNLSHTDGLIACAVVNDREIGIDVENTERPGSTIEIADRFFSPEEVATLHALPAAAQRARFFEYWTLKESYIKARAMGLSLPLEQFSFDLSEGQPIRISFDPRLPDDPLSWQFGLFRPTARHVMAVSIRRQHDPDLDIRLRQTVPLVF